MKHEDNTSHLAHESPIGLGAPTIDLLPLPPIPSSSKRPPMASSSAPDPIPSPALRERMAVVIASPRFLTTAYAVYSLVWTLAVGAAHFASLEHQLFLSQARQLFRADALGLGNWSAPLDDVFIHFDFARSAARGYPFQWSEGNGYSSGGTSLLYPLVLALGYRIGYDGPSLMLWAGIIASASTWFVLIALRRLWSGFSPWCWLLIPPVYFAVGALNWSLWSGMEVAFYLAVWALCLVAWHAVITNPTQPGETERSIALGLACMVFVATRPESAPIVACFVISAVACTWRQFDVKRRLRLFLVGSVPGALVVIAQMSANKILTGETSAAGALVKLEAHDPRLTATQVWDAWVFHLKYQLFRVTDYHMSDSALELGGMRLSYGWIAWVFAAVALFSRRTRRFGILLWVSAALWIFTVAFNGQVRWQNERYTMPAVAWLLVATALGLSVTFTYVATHLRELWRTRQSAPIPFAKWGFAVTLLAVTLLSTATYAAHTLPRQREQLWFFGRASRNIHDQHIVTGKLLTRTPAQRVLVGDAGAIPYVSDLPAVDIIGLGGLSGYPFARATRLGLPAAIELISRMPPHERPDVMAIYPTWWDELPLWFGEKLYEVPVRGNVICGGASKVVYKANWSALPAEDVPMSVNRREHVVATLDLADIVNEKELAAQFTGVPPYVAMKMLPHPKNLNRALWDGGRPLPPGATIAFQVPTVTAHEPARVIVRLAPSSKGTIQIKAGGHVETVPYTSDNKWQEFELNVPSSAVRDGLPVEITSIDGETVVYHVWVVQGS